MEGVTIVIQGRLKGELIHQWISCYQDWNVVLSTWNDENIQGFVFPKNWVVLLMPKPERYGNIHNLDLQVTSTLNGLKYVKTPYTIKVRGDEFYLNLHRFVKEMKLKSEQILCGNIFYRALHPNTFYHISDHFLGGTTENLGDMFTNTFRLLSQGFRFPAELPITHSAEPYLGWAFVQEKERIPLSDIGNYLKDEISHPLCERWFDTFDVEKFTEYTVTRGGNHYSSKCNCDTNF